MFHRSSSVLFVMALMLLLGGGPALAQSATTTVRAPLSTCRVAVAGAEVIARTRMAARHRSRRRRRHVRRSDTAWPACASPRPASSRPRWRRSGRAGRRWCCARVVLRLGGGHRHARRRAAAKRRQLDGHHLRRARQFGGRRARRRAALDPGFNLFRRNSSRVANPTTQGVTLRGVSGSGASRTLVLADGVPLNDPFGSWVYWNRVPQAAVDRIEVVRGATGDLYGADALGGVIQVLTFAADRTPRARHHRRRIVRYVPRLVVRRRGKKGWAFAAAPSEGTAPTAPSPWRPKRAARRHPRRQRLPDGIRHRRQAGRELARGTEGAAYTEERGNGTPVQVNTTDWQQFSGNAGGLVARRRLAGAERRQQPGLLPDVHRRSADRTTERLTTEQTTDTKHATVGGQWTRAVGRAR